MIQNGQICSKLICILLTALLISERWPESIIGQSCQHVWISINALCNSTIQSQEIILSLRKHQRGHYLITKISDNDPRWFELKRKRIFPKHARNHASILCIHARLSHRHTAQWVYVWIAWIVHKGISRQRTRKMLYYLITEEYSWNMAVTINIDNFAPPLFRLLCEIVGDCFGASVFFFSEAALLKNPLAQNNHPQFYTMTSKNGGQLFII